jgi:hypothetical protein
MSTKFVRFVAALVVVVSIVGSTGVAGGARGAPPSVSAQNLEPSRGPETQPLDRPALDIPPASSLGVQFVHVATAANIVGYRTIIDHPLTNGKPGAIILVTPNFNPGGVVGPYEDHPISVVYYSGSQWAIFNQDLAAMPVGAAFNVIIPTAGANVFVHTATAGNSYYNHTYIDNALTNDNPNAIVFVTPNWNPGGVGGTYANFPIGVYYDTLASKWAIFNQNNTPDSMPVNASFNVFVPTAGTGVFVHTATAGNSGGDWTSIDNPLTNGNPNAIVFVTPNWNPGGTIGGTYDNHNIGVYYGGGKWRIFNQDWAAVPVNAAFNVLVLVPASDIFVHTATATNSGGDWTKIDNALTNGHPNAIVFVTPNFNPGGGAGTTDPHPLGVYYNTASQWAIFNQDIAVIPVNAAFNVLVPNPDTSVFVHKATAANSPGDYTIIDHPLTNGHPGAIIFVTPNWNPGGVGVTYNPHPIGVGYLSGKWFILNEDLADMPVGAAFNVFVPTAGPGVFVHTATAGNSYSDYTVIDNPLTNGNPNAIVFVTPNAGGTSNPYPPNVWYTGSKWAISNQDPAAAMPVFATFNVYVVPRYKLSLPLILR